MTASPAEELTASGGSDVDDILGADADFDEPVKLSNGTLVIVQPLKLRQLLRLLRIITRGGAHLLPALLTEKDQNSEDFVSRFVGLVIFAIPEAEETAVQFFQSMVNPIFDIDDRLDSKRQESVRMELLKEFYEFMDNPELEDIVTIIETVATREREDLEGLGKRLAGMLKVAGKVGELKTTQTPELSARTQKRSTSSARSTAGKTKKSSSSRSGGSGRS